MTISNLLTPVRHLLTARDVSPAARFHGLRAALVVTLAVLAWSTPLSVEAQTPGNAQAITYASGSTMIDAIIARPAGAGKNPAVVIVHDDLGANQKFRDLAQQFAQAGFVALVPNLPSRAKKPAVEEPATSGRSSPQAPVNGLTGTQITDDLRAAVEFLQKDAAVDATKISVVGVGWGEFRAWRLAEAVPTLYRAVVFYGVIDTDDERIKTVKIPVLGHYAEYDYLATMRTLKTKHMLGDKFTYFVYPTVPGFMGGGTGSLVPGPGASGRMVLRKKDAQAAAAAAKQAWDRTVDFLKGAAPKMTAGNAPR
jgi:carboxymethylenebutenolidase